LVKQSRHRDAFHSVSSDDMSPRSQVRLDWNVRDGPLFSSKAGVKPPMNLQELLPPGGIEALASQLGVPRNEAERGAQALLPSVVGGMGQNTSRLDSQVSALGGTALSANVVGSEPTQVDHGNQLLDSIFGSKDTSRDVAGHAAQSSGLDPALLKKMLPILAMLVAGHLSGRAGGQQGGLGSILGSVLGGMGAGGSAGGGLGGILGSVLGGRR
jgi:hypothetical protein